MQINPGETLPLVYLLGDTTDSNTYYVRAVIRNSLTNAIIDTVNLTVDPTNSRRFLKNFQAPQNSSNQGLYIDVTVTVYTDSGYTIKSTVYPEQIQTYIISQRYSLAFGAPGGGADIDYKKLEAIILALIKTNIKIPTYKEVDLKPLLNELILLQTNVKGIKIPKYQNVDYTPHFDKIAFDLREVIKSMPKFEKTDLAPLLKEFRRIDIDKLEQITSSLKTIAQGIEKAASQSGSSMTISMKAIEENLKKMLLAATTAEKFLSDKNFGNLSSDKKPIPTPFNIKRLLKR